MSIPILPPVGPPPPIPFGGPVSSTSVSGANQAAYLSSIADNESLTIINFSSIILSSSNEAAATAWQVQQFNAASRKDMYNAWIAQALDLLSLYKKFLLVGKTYDAIARSTFFSILSFNNSLSITYNNGVAGTNAQIIAVNLAITQYNAGTITLAELQTAINTYNTYAAGRNSLINATNTSITNLNNVITNANQAVTAINQELAGVGKPLPLQQAYTGSPVAPLPILPPPGAPPISQVTYTATPLPLANYTMRTLKNADDSVDIASELFAPYFDLMNGQYAITAEMLEQQSSFQGFIQFILAGKLPFLPDAFYIPSSPVTTSGNSSGGSVSSMALTTSLSAVALEGILAQSQLLASVSREEFALNFNIVTRQMQYLQSSLLAQLGLQAGSSSLRLLEGRLPFIDLRASPVAAALGLSLASEIGLAVSNGDLSSPILDILARAFPHIDAANLNSLAKQLSTTAELALLFDGLFQLGQSLNQPQLFGQVLSTLPNRELLGLAPPSVSAVLSDKNIFESAQDILTRDLVRNANISEAKAKAIVDRAFNTSDTSGESIGNDYTNSLIQEGIDIKRATNSQNLFNEIIHSETKGRNILNESVNDHDTSQTVISNQAVNDIIKKNPDLTFRQLRDELSAKFIENGATSTEAIRQATAVVTGIPSFQPVSQEVLASNLQTTGTDVGLKLGFNPTQAATFGSELSATTIHLGNLINDRIGTLAKLNNEKVDDGLKDLANEYLAPIQNLYVFADKLRDPANTFLYCAQLGLMYAHPQPGNYIKGADFIV